MNQEEMKKKLLSMIKEAENLENDEVVVVNGISVRKDREREFRNLCDNLYSMEIGPLMNDTDAITPICEALISERNKAKNDSLLIDANKLIVDVDPLIHEYQAVQNDLNSFEEEYKKVLADIESLGRGVLNSNAVSSHAALTKKSEEVFGKVIEARGKILELKNKINSNLATVIEKEMALLVSEAKNLENENAKVKAVDGSTDILKSDINYYNSLYILAETLRAANMVKTFSNDEEDKKLAIVNGVMVLTNKQKERVEKILGNIRFLECLKTPEEAKEANTKFLEVIGDKLQNMIKREYVYAKDDLDYNELSKNMYELLNYLTEVNKSSRSVLVPVHDNLIYVFPGDEKKILDLLNSTMVLEQEGEKLKVNEEENSRRLQKNQSLIDDVMRYIDDIASRAFDSQRSSGFRNATVNFGDSYWTVKQSDLGETKALIEIMNILSKARTPLESIDDICYVDAKDVDKVRDLIKETKYFNKEAEVSLDQEPKNENVEETNRRLQQNRNLINDLKKYMDNVSLNAYYSQKTSGYKNVPVNFENSYWTVKQSDLSAAKALIGIMRILRKTTVPLESIDDICYVDAEDVDKIRDLAKKTRYFKSKLKTSPKKEEPKEEPKKEPEEEHIVIDYDDDLLIGEDSRLDVEPLKPVPNFSNNDVAINSIFKFMNDNADSLREDEDEKELLDTYARYFSEAKNYESLDDLEEVDSIGYGRVWILKKDIDNFKDIEDMLLEPKLPKEKIDFSNNDNLINYLDSFRGVSFNDYELLMSLKKIIKAAKDCKDTNEMELISSGISINGNKSDIWILRSDLKNYEELVNQVNDIITRVNDSVYRIKISQDNQESLKKCLDYLSENEKSLNDNEKDKFQEWYRCVLGASNYTDRSDLKKVFSNFYGDNVWILENRYDDFKELDDGLCLIRNSLKNAAVASYDFRYNIEEISNADYMLHTNVGRLSEDDRSILNEYIGYLTNAMHSTNLTQVVDEFGRAVWVENKDEIVSRVKEIQSVYLVNINKLYDSLQNDDEIDKYKEIFIRLREIENPTEIEVHVMDLLSKALEYLRAGKESYSVRNARGVCFVNDEALDNYEIISEELDSIFNVDMTATSDKYNSVNDRLLELEKDDLSEKEIEEKKLLNEELVHLERSLEFARLAFREIDGVKIILDDVDAYIECENKLLALKNDVLSHTSDMEREDVSSINDVAIDKYEEFLNNFRKISELVPEEREAVDLLISAIEYLEAGKYSSSPVKSEYGVYLATEDDDQAYKEIVGRISTIFDVDLDSTRDELGVVERRLLELEKDDLSEKEIEEKELLNEKKGYLKRSLGFARLTFRDVNGVRIIRDDVNGYIKCEEGLLALKNEEKKEGKHKVVNVRGIKEKAKGFIKNNWKLILSSGALVVGSVLIGKNLSGVILSNVGQSAKNATILGSLGGTVALASIAVYNVYNKLKGKLGISDVQDMQYQMRETRTNRGILGKIKEFSQGLIESVDNSIREATLIDAMGQSLNPDGVLLEDGQEIDFSVEDVESLNPLSTNDEGVGSGDVSEVPVVEVPDDVLGDLSGGDIDDLGSGEHELSDDEKIQKLEKDIERYQMILDTLTQTEMKVTYEGIISRLNGELDRLKENSRGSR